MIGDGRRINFWTDRWLLKSSLQEMVIGELPAGYEQVKARELWIVGRGWDLPKILPYVVEERRLDLAAVVLDTVIGAKDRMSWVSTSDGNFTVSSAYRLLTQNYSPKPDMERFYE